MSAAATAPAAPRRSRLRRRLAEDRPAFGLSYMLGDPQIAEEFSAAGCDYIYIDGQHGVGSESELFGMLRAIDRSRTTPLVRVARNDPALIGRALDAGAEGVIVPMVDTPEDAARAAEACRYPPQGRRSWGPLRAMHGLGSVPDVVNGEVLCLVMIESRTALMNVEAIVATPGVDGVYIGPADLAVSLGGRPVGLEELQADDGVLDAIHEIRTACADANSICAISGPPASPLSRGFDMLTVGSDIGFIRVGLADSLAALSSAFTTRKAPHAH